MIKKILTNIHTSTGTERDRVILSLLEQNKSARVIDLGCWDGNLTLKMGKTIGATDLYGIDINEKSLASAKEKGVKGFLSDLNKPFPVDSEVFDVVISMETIEHIPLTDHFIKEAYRILKPEGYLVITTPNLASLHSIFALILGAQPFASYVSDEVRAGLPFHVGEFSFTYHKLHPSHYRLFTVPALKELFEYHGFKVERIAGVGYYPFHGKIGRVFSRLDPRHAVYLVMKARKVQSLRDEQKKTKTRYS